MKRNYKRILFFTVILAVFSFTVRGQSFDYQSKPVFAFDYLETAVDLNLNIQQAALMGSVTYLLRANSTGADSLILHAPEITVDSVLVGSKTLNYFIQNGLLNIALPDSGLSGQFQIQIYYQTDPRFGLLKDSEGTIWTSLLPKSHRHWMPSPDHPRVETVTTLTLNVPADYRIAATGVKTDEEILGLERKEVTFRSSKPVPITSLSFAAGNFNTEGTSYGIKRIITYAGANTISDAEQNRLADQAREIVRQIENAAEMEYPYQRVHVVVLNDHFWEQKPYGASVIYLYQNRGDLINQLRRGLYAQWFGVYQHEAQWADARPIQLFQSALHYKIADEPAFLKSKDSPEKGFSTIYERYSVDRWNFWQNMPQWNVPRTQQIAMQIIPKVLALGSGTFTPAQYDNIWYRYSGMPSIEVPAFENDQKIENEGHLYRVDYDLQNQSLKLVFTAEENALQNPQTLSLQIVEGGSVRTEKITFAGMKDSVSVAVSPTVQNVRFRLNSDNQLRFEIHKPVPFILYQLDNAESVRARKKAALQLGYHTGNPDLQLLITGYLNRETESEVKAALLKSYAAITGGAAGTQQYFIEALDSPHPEVRQAAIEALQKYPKNAEVTAQIRNVIDASDSLSDQALEMYMRRIDSTQALTFVKNLVQQDTAGTRAINAIAALAEAGKTETAVELAQYYIQPVYIYPVRKKALSVLLIYDDSAEKWNERLQMLLTDLDPRIRYLTVQNLESIPGVNEEAVLEKYLPTIFDERIWKDVNEF